MKRAAIRDYLLSRPEAVEDFPFGPDVAVIKVRGRMFATISNRGDAVAINLKCDPDEASILRDIFTAVVPGYHMNKRHWNTVILDGSIARGEIERMVDNSYALVVRGLRASDRRAMELQHGREALYPADLSAPAGK